MKKFILLTILPVCFSNAQSIHTYNFKVNPGTESSVGSLFSEFHGKYKRKSGGVTLQRVRFLDGVTHRIMVYGNPKDWGTEEKRPQMAWQSYLRGMRSLRSSAKGSYTAKSMYWKGGDRDKYKVSRQWLFKAKDPSKYASAYVKFAKAIEPMIGERMMGVGKIEMGDLGGATHYSVFYGESMQDLEIMADKIRASKAFQEFVKTNGGREILVSYMVTDLIRN